VSFLARTAVELTCFLCGVQKYWLVDAAQKATYQHQYQCLSGAQPVIIPSDIEQTLQDIQTMHGSEGVGVYRGGRGD
jgi:hypothetical protein